MKIHFTLNNLLELFHTLGQLHNYNATYLDWHDTFIVDFLGGLGIMQHITTATDIMSVTKPSGSFQELIIKITGLKTSQNNLNYSGW